MTLRGFHLLTEEYSLVQRRMDFRAYRIIEALVPNKVDPGKVFPSLQDLALGDAEDEEDDPAESFEQIKTMLGTVAQNPIINTRVVNR